MNTPLSQHNHEIFLNLNYYRNKPILKTIFSNLHRRIATSLRKDIAGPTVEIGSGIGLIKNTIPGCITTDIFPNPWIDQVENVYALSFSENTIANIILFHIFHHLRYPGNALAEINRVLKPGGRLVIFEHCSSGLLGRIVNTLHHEPAQMLSPIQWTTPAAEALNDGRYYAALGNATRIFEYNNFSHKFAGWNSLNIQKYSCLTYILSGGFSRPQLFPRKCLNIVNHFENICDLFPRIFATSMIIRFEKTSL